jgi:hypothetical protein
VRNPREASQLFALCFPEGIHIGHCRSRRCLTNRA